MDVYDNVGDEILAIRDVFPDDLSNGVTPVTITAQVTTRRNLEFRVFWHAVCDGAVHRIVVVPEKHLASAPG
ncbi:MAG: hypothetical protein DWQ08_12605 [Proteobacteria bacterium]|nr:MAG: hypothetical protein DWQ08_12605 [Pseudomonadota bacterium]